MDFWTNICMDNIASYSVVHVVKARAKSNNVIVSKSLLCASIVQDQILYLSVLKPGSNTRRGSNIRRVEQQNERNKCLGSFKRRVSKLLNLINFQMVPNVK